MNLQDQLSEIVLSLDLLKVEVTLILGAIFLLIVGLINKSNGLIKGIYGLTLVLAFYFNLGIGTEEIILSKSLALSAASQNFTAIFLVAAILILLYKRSNEHATEFYFFMLSILVGSIFILKANSFLVTYLSIELTSFTAYILTNFSFRKSGFEAGLKYLLFGAVSTAMMLFGFGLIYGYSGAFFITELQSLNGVNPVNLGIVMVIFGLLFKTSVVPFHIWVPATYQSAPNDVVAILSIVPKLASFVLLQRVLISLGGPSWLVTFCLTLGILTIITGTFSALRQVHARRMISMGAIAHSGFLLPLAIIDTETSNQAFWLYACVYSIMNVAIFYLLNEFEKKDIHELSHYGGLGKKESVLNISMTVVLISLVGLPPLAGFTAKFFLFGSLWESYTIGGESLIMIYLIMAVFATVVSLFFYLKIPYQMFLVKTETSPSIEFPISTKIIATLFSIVLLLLFFVPQILTVMQQLLNSPIAHE